MLMFSGFRYRLVPVWDGQFGYKRQDGVWDGMIGELTKGVSNHIDKSTQGTRDVVSTLAQRLQTLGQR